MKRKHTKLICLGLALCLLTGLALGCGSSANDTKTASAEATVQNTDQTMETTAAAAPDGGRHRKDGRRTAATSRYTGRRRNSRGRGT